MNYTLALRTERDVVQARQRAREIASRLGFDNQEQIRLATATSEMARNAFRYARDGKVQFKVLTDLPQTYEITVTDSGPGISNLDEVLEGRYRSETGMGLGIIGTRRLMDRKRHHSAVCVFQFAVQQSHTQSWMNVLTTFAAPPN